MFFLNPSLHQVKRGIHNPTDFLTKLYTYPNVWVSGWYFIPIIYTDTLAADDVSEHKFLGIPFTLQPVQLLGSHANGTDVATRGMELKTGVKKASKLEAMESETVGFP